MKRPVLLPVLYVEIVVHFPTGTAKKIKANKKPPKSIQPLIYFLFPGNHLEYLFFIDSFFYSSVLTHGELGPICNLFKHNGKSSNGRGLDGLVGTVIWINTGSQLKRSPAVTWQKRF